MIARPILLCFSVFLSATLQLRADTYFVTTTADTGAGSLRQAMLDANGHVNIDASTPDAINFAIGGGLRTITPLSPLPAITDPVVIDGYTQSGSSANTLAVGDNSVHLIELNGNGAAFKALVITAGHSTVRGLVINTFNGNGATVAITLQTGGNNTVVGCFLGLNAAGTAGATNRDFGVDIENSPNNLIGGTTPAARNVISGNNTAIQINGPASSGTTIQGNYIGTNAAGTAALLVGGVSQSVIGISIGNNGAGTGSSNNTIGGPTSGARNVVSGNASVGIKVFDNTITGTLIQGNYVGTNAAGTAGIANGDGVFLLRAVNTTVNGNVISGNGNGLNIANGSGPTGVGNLVQANLIGTNAAGTAAIPNIFGVNMDSAQNNTIGGTTIGAGNLISGNSNAGLTIGSGFPVATANVVQGNFIGTDITGTVKLGNGASGVVVFAGNNPIGVNTIGGTIAAARNIISGNTNDGVAISNASNTLVQGNFIGTDVNGTANLGNNGYGVTVSNGNNNMIGGTTTGSSNVIAFNGSTFTSSGGVGVLGGTGNSILGNSIFSNTGGDPTRSNPGLGINLFSNGETSGVTPNDPGDADTGANNLQNFPLITSVTFPSGSVNITGSLNSTASTSFRLEFFANDSPDPSGFGEGKTFLGFNNVTTDASGNVSFNVSFPVTGTPGSISATATDPNGNTSEFSAAFSTRLLNISTRLRVLTGEQVLIGGFIITGADNKKVIIRGIGPSLSGLGISGTLQNPTLSVQGNGISVTNDNWKVRDSDGSSQQAEIEASTIPPSNDLESALVQTLSPGNYTAILGGKNNTTGIGLVEVYDLNQSAGSRLANISTRGFVDTNDNVMIGGFIIGPAATGSIKVLVRAIGPSLSSSGIQGALQDPTLELHDLSGTTIATNDNWKVSDTGGSQQTEIEATTIPPKDDRESALLQTLAPGNYTAIVRGKNNTTGVGLVEIYNLQ